MIIRSETGQNQMVEIQSGGGFLSFDAPVAHFGLGPLGKVDEVEIRWSTRESSVIKGPFAAGARYIITRRTEPAS